MHVNALFKADKNGFTVKIKRNIYIQVQNAVDE